ncbi:Vacuolar protein-sorting-associated protein 36 [Marasmius crinis-equi]|uniref:Vacuolar protein-sorting-associated protein 36 n=1 Tax=Marasmius crinis-equi TaxID=585013 RepID=A0ABR3FAL3_9AGAR
MDLTTSIDGTIPVPALLLDTSEDLITSTDAVGVYSDLTTKSPNHQNGDIHLTSHRLFYIDNANAERFSFALSLGLVQKTEHYTGLFASSPKISLFLGADTRPTESEWVCSVCGYRNGPGLTGVCGLCGVQREQETKKEEVGCRVCTFINEPGATKCEMCESPLSGPPPSSSSSLIRLSFRRGGDKVFYNDLKRALKGKAWTINRTSTPIPGTGSGGITHILSLNENTQSNTNSSLSSALLDLEALSIKAKEMVKVANDLSERLASLDSTPETNSLLSSFSNLAISKPTSLESTPVTQEMYKSDKLFLSSLATELASVLSSAKDPLIPLDRLWVQWNRARGVSLIPPSTFLDVLPLLPSHTGYRLRQLGTTKILYTPHFSTSSVASRVSSLVAESPLTPTSFSIHEHIPIPLAQLLLEEVEMLPDTPIARDDWESAIRVGGGSVLEPNYHPNNGVRGKVQSDRHQGHFERVSVLDRYLQRDSDDPGAKKQIFVLDASKHPTDNIKDFRLADSQTTTGELFRVFIRTDTSKIGKYGIGFRSTYHIMDQYPQVMSGATLAIFDPHSGIFHDGGKRVDMQSCEDQFSDFISAFNSVLTPRPGHAGTALHLPFRVDPDSEISSRIITAQETKELWDGTQCYSTQNGEGITSCFGFNKVMLLSDLPSQYPPPVDVLARAGVNAARVPSYIYDILHRQHPDIPFLKPLSLGQHFRTHLQKLETLSSLDKPSLLEYLVSDQQLQNIIDLPIIPLPDGRFTALHSTTQEPKHTLLSEGDLEIFQSFDEDAIALHLLPQPVAQLPPLVPTLNLQ